MNDSSAYIEKMVIEGYRRKGDSSVHDNFMTSLLSKMIESL